MSEQQVDPKVWIEKDLRMVRMNALSHASLLMAHGCVTPTEGIVKEVLSIATDFVDFVYTGMDKPDNIDKGGVQCERNPVVAALHTELKDAGYSQITYDQVAKKIMDTFGKLPTNMSSLAKIKKTINFN